MAPTLRVVIQASSIYTSHNVSYFTGCHTGKLLYTSHNVSYFTGCHTGKLLYTSHNVSYFTGCHTGKLLYTSHNVWQHKTAPCFPVNPVTSLSNKGKTRFKILGVSGLPTKLCEGQLWRTVYDKLHGPVEVNTAITEL